MKGYCRTTEKNKHSHKGFCGADIFDDYDNLKFKIEVHYETISKQVSINWKETLQVNVTAHWSQCIQVQVHWLQDKFFAHWRTLTLPVMAHIIRDIKLFQFSVYSLLPLLISKVFGKWDFCLKDEHLLSSMYQMIARSALLRPQIFGYLVPIKKRATKVQNTVW